MNKGTGNRESQTTEFKVIIPGIHDITFRSCEGIESEVGVNYLPEGGSLKAPRTARGTQQVNKISFTHGISSSGKGKPSGDTLFKWYLDVCDSSKPLNKKTISIKIIDENGDRVAEWRIINAWPCRWVGPMLSTEVNKVTVEYVSFAHEGIEMN